MPVAAEASVYTGTIAEYYRDMVIMSLLWQILHRDGLKQ